MPGQEPRDYVQEQTYGPWDVLDAPDDDRERIDLGALQVPALPGYDLRVEVSQEGQVVAATLASPRGEMQLGVFAAPRSAGIWDEVRKEIKATVSSQGGTISEQTGAFGPELTGRVPMPNGQAAARFVGIDGPRWFLRALLAGAPAEPARAARFEDLLRNVIVVRGNEPFPVREPVPLRLPKDVVLPPEMDTTGQ